MKILITGVAGFVGMHVARDLLASGNEVIGMDNLNDYYSAKLKSDRVEQLRVNKLFEFHKGDLVDSEFIGRLFKEKKPEMVIHLAAQPGVRYSLKNPLLYIQSNIVGFANILECCRHNSVRHLVFASSSSVYGGNTEMPFSTTQNVDHPLSLYAATKKSNELMAYSYSHLYGLPTTGLRYFTVYGPWGRPDMSPWLFTSAILEAREINVFNHGRMKRDFTYVDDISRGTIAVLERIPKEDALGAKGAPYKIYNIGNNKPVELMEFIGTIESILGIKAKINFLPMQDGDVISTFADISDIQQDTDFRPSTDLQEGLGKWVEWYRGYHHK